MRLCDDDPFIEEMKGKINSALIAAEHESDEVTTDTAESDWEHAESVDTSSDTDEVAKLRQQDLSGLPKGAAVWRKMHKQVYSQACSALSQEGPASTEPQRSTPSTFTGSKNTPIPSEKRPLSSGQADLPGFLISYGICIELKPYHHVCFR